MAQYIIEMDSSVHADATAAQSAITSAGGTITKTYSFPLTYKVECESSEYDAISGKKYGELVTTAKTITPSFNTNHLKMMCNDLGSSSASYDPQSTGLGEHVYLVDTGVNTTHAEFSGRTVNNLYTGFGSDFADADGHGTTMASLIVGANVGSAKNATLHNVKLMNANPYTGTVADIIEALEAILAHHNSNTPSQTKTVVACWTSDKNSLIDSKFAQLEDNNMIVVAAAGNHGGDSNDYSPGGLDSVITVGAMNSVGHVGYIGAGASNLGEENDVYALGVDVSVINFADNSTYTTAEGTSVAAAQVGGLVAQYTDLYPSAGAFKIKSYVINEGMIEGRGRQMSFDSALVTASGVNSDNLKKSIAVSPQTADVTLSDLPSGIIITVANGQSANANLQIKSGVTDLGILGFSPLPPFCSFTQVGDDYFINADTSNVSNMANVTVPGIYHFSLHGNVSGTNSIEEYSIGIYTNDENELISANEFYYDDEATSYDQVVNFNAAKLEDGQTNVFSPLGL